jgi:hypothetical protein
LCHRLAIPAQVIAHHRANGRAHGCADDRVTDATAVPTTVLYDDRGRLLNDLGLWCVLRLNSRDGCVARVVGWSRARGHDDDEQEGSDDAANHLTVHGCEKVLHGFSLLDTD